MKELVVLLNKSPVFQGIKPERLNELLHKVNFQVLHYMKNEFIAIRGDACNSLQIIVKGEVKAEMIDLSGKIVKIENITAPRPLAPAFLFGNNNTYPVDIVAINSVSVLKLPRHSVVQLLQSDEIFLTNYLDVISARTQFLSKKLYFFSFKTIKEKVANYLVENLQKNRTTLHTGLSQQELAEYFGVTRPSLARTLGEMEKAGIIKINRREINVLNIDGLKQLVDR